MTAIPDPQSQHEDAVVHAEVRKLVRALAPYRVLHRDRLKRFAGTERWRESSFEHALAEAVRSGALERLPGEFYATPLTRQSTPAATHRQPAA